MNKTPKILSPAQYRLMEITRGLQYFVLMQLFFTAMVLSFSFGGEVVFGLMIGVPPLVAWAAGGKNGYRFIFYFICMAFVVGQRTLYIGDHFRIVPSAVLLWGLAALCLVVKPNPFAKRIIPWSIVTLSFSCLPAIALRLLAGADWNEGLYYSHMMWMSIPAFFICSRLINRQEHIRTILTIMFLGGFFLSFLALSEYFQFGYIKYFSNFLVQDAAMMSQEQFKRLGAGFWGGPMLAGYLTLWFPLILSHFFNSKTLLQRFIILLSLTLIFLTIYFSGHRGLWIALVFAVGVFFYLKGIKGVFILLLLVGIGLQFMPEHAKTRIESLTGAHEDTSAKKRKVRAEFAWELIKKNPVMGAGWGASGLVHSDFLQLWADAGLGAEVGLAAIFIQIFRRLKKFSKKAKKEYKEYAHGFIASLAAALVILLGQAWFNLPEQYTPFWIFMGLAYNYSNIIQIEMSQPAVVKK